MTFPVSSLPVAAFVLIPLLLAALFLTGVTVNLAAQPQTPNPKLLTSPVETS